jgi:hypothetical protein
VEHSHIILKQVQSKFAVSPANDKTTAENATEVEGSIHERRESSSVEVCFSSARDYPFKLAHSFHASLSQMNGLIFKLSESLKLC